MSNSIRHSTIMFLLILMSGTLTSVNAQVLVSIKSTPQEENLKSIPLQKALFELENRFKISFHYNNSIVQDLYVKNIDLKNSKVDELLNQLLEPLKLRFKKISNTVYLIQHKEEKGRELERIHKKSIQGDADESNATSSASQAAFSNILKRGLVSIVQRQDVPVKGRVVIGETGEGIPGANVVVKGTTIGTLTDAAGNYTLNVPDLNAVLIFSYVGMVSEEVSIAGQSTIDVKLVPDIQALQEVVVVGYGTQQRRDVSGSISSIKEQDIKKIPVTNTEQALVGRAAGVQVIQNGEPGTGATIRIRGVGSTGNPDNNNVGNDPLWIVDGIPTTGVTNLNPNDIESMDILKDASATAIYGSRASNGVIIITTKRGKEGKARVEFDAYYGFEKSWRKLDVLSGPDFARLANEAYSNSGRPLNPAWSNPDALPTYDWQDAVFNTAPVQNYNLTISGGTSKLRSALIVGYNQREGIIINSDYQRVSLRLNNDYEVSKRLKFGSSFQISRSKRHGASTNNLDGGMLNTAYQMHPDQPIYNPDGTLAAIAQDAPGLYYPRQLANPVASSGIGRQDRFELRTMGNIFGELEILDGLKFRTSLGGDITNWNNKSYRPSISNLGFLNNPNSSLNWERNEGINFIFNNVLSYNKVIAERHAISITAGMEGIKDSWFGMSVNAIGFPSNGLQVPDAAGTKEGDRRGGGSGGENALLSYFARVNYIYNDKYILTLNGRADASSRLPKANRWGYFPSAAVAWRISKEEFLANLPLVNDLKIRASWGKSGNQSSLGSFDYLTAYGVHDVGYSFGAGDANGNQAAAIVVRPVTLGNSAIKWETQTMYDAGIDASLLNNSITFTADYYNKVTDGLIVNVPVPATLGAPNNKIRKNAGSVRNSGFEFALGYSKNKGAFTWGVNANLTTLKNEVISLGIGEGQPIYSSIRISSGAEGATKTEKGNPIGYFYGLETDGLFQTEDEVELSSQKAEGAKPGDRRFVDQDKDGKINDKDRVNLGSPLPKFYYGLNLNASFLGFDFSMLIAGQQGNKIFNAMKSQLYGIRNFNGEGVQNTSTDLLNRWTGPGTSNTIPRLAYDENFNNRRGSDFYVEDGSFLRCRNIQLGYTIPSSITEKWSISRVRLYLMSQNLFTITKYSGYDPEISNSNALQSGVDYGQYPQARGFFAGLNLQF